MHRSLSTRSKQASSGTGSSGGGSHRVGFSLSSLRGSIQPELSRKIYKLIKTTNNLIGAHETAGRERASIATQLSEWGEQTEDEAISDIADKVGVIISELGEQEDTYAHSLDDARGVLKQIRNTEKSVQPARDSKRKIVDEIAKLKTKEPESAKLPILEQELVRAEADNLVADAQLTNITREKLKDAYDAEFLATIERAEKQIILARHGRRLLRLLDDTPVVPGDQRHPYAHGPQARQILDDAEDDLRDWRPESDDQLYEQGAQHGQGQGQIAQGQSPTTAEFGAQGGAQQEFGTQGGQQDFATQGGQQEFGTQGGHQEFGTQDGQQGLGQQGGHQAPASSNYLPSGHVQEIPSTQHTEHAPL